MGRFESESFKLIRDGSGMPQERLDKTAAESFYSHISSFEVSAFRGVVLEPPGVGARRSHAGAIRLYEQ